MASAAATGGGRREALGEAVSTVWSYLDKLAEKNPQEYKRFINKAMQERRDYLEPPYPMFCFTTGIRGKVDQKLYVNICKWSRVPTKEEADDALIPVQGGVLRCLVEGGKRHPNSLLLDIAFNPDFVDSCLTDSNMLDIFLRLVLDFIDEYLSILTDRNTEILPPETRFKGPEADIFHSLDQSNPERITKESWMDFEDNLLANLKKGKKTKTGRKGSSGTNGLPPLFPRQQQQQSNQGNRGSPKLIEELAGGPGASSSKSKKSKNGGKNGGGGGGRKGGSHTAANGSKNKKREMNSENGCGLGESGRGSRDSGETAESRQSDGGHYLEKVPETSGRSLVSEGGEVSEGGSGRRVIPERSVTVREEGGRSVVIVKVKLPDVTSADQISLDSSESDLCVTAGDSYSICVPFPFHVNPDLSTSTFSKRSQTLTIRLPASDHTETKE